MINKKIPTITSELGTQTVDLKTYFKKNLVIKLKLMDYEPEELGLCKSDCEHIKNGLKVLEKGFNKIGKVKVL